MQQDICYIFRDELLTSQKKKKKEDCAFQVQENYGFVLLTRITFLLCIFPVPLKRRVCSPCPGCVALVPCTENPEQISAAGAKSSGSFHVRHQLVAFPSQTGDGLSVGVFQQTPWAQRRQPPLSLLVAVTGGGVSAVQMSPSPLIRSFVFLEGDLEEIRYAN